jgi:hypothetical protein
MRAPKEYGGQDMYTTWTYTRIVRMQEFEYVLRFTDESGTPVDPASFGVPRGTPKEVRNRNVFRDMGNGRTQVTITESVYTSDEARNLSRAGLEQCLDKMAASLAGAASL